MSESAPLRRPSKCPQWASVCSTVSSILRASLCRAGRRRLFLFVVYFRKHIFNIFYRYRIWRVDFSYVVQITLLSIYPSIRPSVLPPSLSRFRVHNIKKNVYLRLLSSLDSSRIGIYIYSLVTPNYNEAMLRTILRISTAKLCTNNTSITKI